MLSGFARKASHIKAVFTKTLPDVRPGTKMPTFRATNQNSVQKLF